MERNSPNAATIQGIYLTHFSPQFRYPNWYSDSSIAHCLLAVRRIDLPIKRRRDCPMTLRNLRISAPFCITGLPPHSLRKGLLTGLCEHRSLDPALGPLRSVEIQARGPVHAAYPARAELVTWRHSRKRMPSSS